MVKSEPSRAPRSVLTVDDSPTLRKLVRVYLMGLDLDFLEASRGDEALAILASKKVDLVIADVNMPGMDGLTFLRTVRASADFTARKIPVALLTSDKLAETRARALASGASAFILKPVTSSDLRETVMKLLGEPDGPNIEGPRSVRPKSEAPTSERPKSVRPKGR